MGTKWREVGVMETKWEKEWSNENIMERERSGQKGGVLGNQGGRSVE